MTSPQFTPPTEIIELGDLPTPDAATARQLVGLLHGGGHRPAEGRGCTKRSPSQLTAN